MDDVDYYNRVHEMMHILSSNNNRDNDDVEGFGYRWDSKDNYFNINIGTLVGIASRQSINASFKPLLGLFGQKQIHPFEVVSFNACV